MHKSTMQLLVCTDFSDCSMMAVHHAARLAERLHARLHLCHVAKDDNRVLMTELGPPIPELLAPAELACQQLRQVLDTLDPKVDAQAHLRIGVPVEEILSLARELDVDLMVVCSHGKGLIRRALLGSVSRQLTLRSSVPVLIVPTPGRELIQEEPAPPQDANEPSVGQPVATDFESRGATGVGIASVGGAAITYR